MKKSKLKNVFSFIFAVVLFILPIVPVCECVVEWKLKGGVYYPIYKDIGFFTEGTNRGCEDLLSFLGVIQIILATLFLTSSLLSSTRLIKGYALSFVAGVVAFLNSLGILITSFVFADKNNYGLIHFFVSLVFIVLILCFAFIALNEEENEYKSDAICFSKFREGEIALYEKDLVIYRNLLPFIHFRYGRIKQVISLSDITSFTYKGCGWFRGVFYITLRNHYKPIKVRLSRWLPWYGYRANDPLEKIIEVIHSKIENNVLRL